MSKAAFYFSHDSNASQDPKILQMCSVYKAEGYGWYWMLIEQMRDQTDYKLNISGKYAIDAFAMRMYCDSITMHKFLDDCVNEFQLFKRDKSCIWSESLLSRMGKMSDKSESAKHAADVRWGKQPRNNADAMQTHSERNANASKTDAIKENKGKENKGKENKGKENKGKENKGKENKGNKSKKESIPKKAYGSLLNVLLTDDQVTKLKDKFNSHYPDKLEYFSLKKAAKGYKYDSDYAAILTWDRNDIKSNTNSIPEAEPSNKTAIPGLTIEDFGK
jgi:hypothetical protein